MKQESNFLSRIKRRAQIGIAAANMLVGGSQAMDEAKFRREPLAPTNEPAPTKKAAAVNALEKKLRMRGKNNPEDMELGNGE